jgi:hypothetical protein
MIDGMEIVIEAGLRHLQRRKPAAVLQAPFKQAAPEGARALLLNAMNVAPEAEDDFNA